MLNEIQNFAKNVIGKQMNFYCGTISPADQKERFFKNGKEISKEEYISISTLRLTQIVIDTPLTDVQIKNINKYLNPAPKKAKKK